MKVAKIYTTSPAPPPDIILASSPSPFVVAAGEKLAKKFRVPCVAEIRDLWPESIFAYFPQKRNKWYAKFLQNYERKIYERADAIIMTWAGGADYIVDLGPEGGDKGGSLVACGTPEQIAKCRRSYTGQYIKKVLESEKIAEKNDRKEDI